MADLLTLDELAERSGVPVASLREWQTRGLVGRGDAVAFAPADVRRARLIGLLLRRGVAVDALAEAERSEGYLGHYLDLLPERSGPRYSVTDAAERIGLDVGMLEGFVSAAGLGDDSLSEEDLGLLRGMKIIRDSGLPEEALTQLLRVVDVVCGMELRPSTVIARLRFGGAEQVFCSGRCLQLFVAAPERYGAPYPTEGSSPTQG